MAARDPLEAMSPGRRSVQGSAPPWWESPGLDVLVADEDPASRAGLQGMFAPRVNATVCGDGAQALWHAGRHEPAVVILSARLPVVSAAEVAAVISRHRGGPGAIAVSVGPGEADLATPVLEAGANSVVSRPYRSHEVEPLLANYLVQRDQVLQRAAVVTVGPLRLDPPAFQASAGGRRLCLRLREFGLLRLLMLHAGSVVSQQHIREQLWEARGDSVSANTIAVHVRRLRAHLDGIAQIVAVRGMGYRLVVDGYGDGGPGPAGRAMTEPEDAVPGRSDGAGPGRTCDCEERG